jgi:hypothetical protein
LGDDGRKGLEYQAGLYDHENLVHFMDVCPGWTILLYPSIGGRVLKKKPLISRPFYQNSDS